MTHVLLTGGAGGIGVHVIAHLLENTDWHITVLDSLRHKGNRDRITDLCGHRPDRIRIIQHDLVCPISRDLLMDIGPVNHILHLAAISDVGYSVRNPRYTIINNVESTLTMLDYAADVDHDTFVYFSTDEVYGPIANHMYGHNEWETLRPSNPYAASKAAGELFAYSYWRAGLVNLVITNATNNFGETQGVSKYPAMTQAKLARGETITVHGTKDEIGSRHYLHSRNTADALLHILTKTTPHQHVEGTVDQPDKYHIVGEDRLDNLEMAQLIAELMGVELDYELVDCHDGNPAHDIHYALRDNTLRATGWKPPISLRDSMKHTIDWHQEHPQWL